MKKTKVRSQIFSALFAGLIAVISIISIPTPSGMPFTLQTFIVALSGFVLGSKYGTLSVLIYLLLGSLGLPVFSGMMGGVGKLMGVTGGFLTGFVFVAAGCGKTASTKLQTALFSAVGLILCHTLGVIWFSFVSEVPLPSAFITASLPYLPKDAVSVAGAYFLGSVIKNRTKIQNK